MLGGVDGFDQDKASGKSDDMLRLCLADLRRRVAFRCAAHPTGAHAATATPFVWASRLWSVLRRRGSSFVGIAFAMYWSP
jgi:hypothetical protein